VGSANRHQGWGISSCLQIAKGTGFDLAMTRHAGDFAVFGIDPDGMGPALVIEEASLFPQVTLKIG
jgi:hypothetical protein